MPDFELSDIVVAEVELVVVVERIVERLEVRSSPKGSGMVREVDRGGIVELERRELG